MGLKEKLYALDIRLNPNQERDFETLTRLLLEYNGHTNITGITDPEEIDNKHYFDSLSALRFIPPNASLCDVGTGGGFPALPLAIMRPDVSVTAVDSTGKKIRFVNEANDTLRLSVNCLCMRAEEHMRNCPAGYDVLTFRAFSDIAKIVTFAPLLRKGGAIIAYKGQREKALAETKLIDTTFNAEFFGYRLPTLDERTLVILKKP